MIEKQDSDVFKLAKAHHEKRVKTALIDVEAVGEYCLVAMGRKWECNTMDTYDLPQLWGLFGVHYSFELTAFMVCIASPDFEPVELGEYPPTMQATRKQVKITREVIE